MPEVTAADLEPLWLALGAPTDVRAMFEQMRAEVASATETDADDFYRGLDRAARLSGEDTHRRRTERPDARS